MKIDHITNDAERHRQKEISFIEMSHVRVIRI
jgi:hypothetical protein